MFYRSDRTDPRQVRMEERWDGGGQGFGWVNEEKGSGQREVGDYG